MSYVKNAINHLSTIIEKLLLLLSITVLILLITSVSLQVFVRYILQDSLPWVQEVSSGLLIWLTFIGSAYLVRGNLHLSVDMFIKKIPQRINQVITRIIYLLNLVFVIVLAVVSFQLFNTQVNAPLGVLGIPRAYYFALPILLFSITTPIYLLESMLNKKS
ncbi:TRAP transporter small permease [Virgibacillus oceani]